MEKIKRIVNRWNVTTQIDFIMLFIVSTYPDWHCSQWLIFTAKIQNLDSNGNHNRKHADANEKHEIKPTTSAASKRALSVLITLYVMRRIYTVSQKKQDPKLLAITSLTITRFSKIFH